MKTLKLLFILITLFILSTMTFAQQITIQLNYSQNDLIIENVDGYQSVGFEDMSFIHNENDIGEPALAVKAISVLLPPNATAQNITLTVNNEELLSQTYYIYPVQEPHYANFSDPPPFVNPDPAIYESASPYPTNSVLNQALSGFRDYNYITIDFVPFRYIPLNRQLYLYTDITITVDYQTGTPPSGGERVRGYNEVDKMAWQFIQRTVKNNVDLDNFYYETRQKIDQYEQKCLELIATSFFNPTFMPSELGGEVKYVIITNNWDINGNYLGHIDETFQQLADWKTKKGTPALIVTTVQISANYGGTDLAEKIRNYLKDAWENWGDGLYVLLGGDTEIIPARIGTHWTYWLTGQTYHWATDYYYADVNRIGYSNYNWNANGNHLYGEDGDGVQLAHENMNGRAAVENITEAETFVNKVITYEKQSNNYENNLLLVGAYHSYWYDNNGNPHGDNIGQRIHNILYNQYLNNLGYLNLWRLYDDYTAPGGYLNQYPGDEELNKTSMLNHLNNGYTFGRYHVISHFDHGSAYVIGTSARMKGNYINRSNMDQLINNVYSQILFTTACDPNEFDKDCFGEHYINNQYNGGVAFFGNSGVGISDGLGLSWENQHKAFFNSLYYDTDVGYRLGVLLEQVRANSTYGSIAKKNMNLLGDPEMPVWTNTPQTLDVVVTPSSITNGQTTVSVTINNLTLDVDATVCLQKDYEDYAYQTVTGTGSPVQVDFIFTPDTPGDLDVTVTAHNYIPEEIIIPVTLTNYAHLYVTEENYDDDDTSPSIGNNDGQVDAGETIELTITLTNSGDVAANSVSAILSTSSSYLSITQNQSGYGNIAPSSSASSQTTYVFEVDRDTPSGEYVEFTLDIQDGASNVYSDNF